jgi:hypothetical protein
MINKSKNDQTNKSDILDNYPDIENSNNETDSAEKSHNIEKISKKKSHKFKLDISNFPLINKENSNSYNQDLKIKECDSDEKMNVITKKIKKHEIDIFF